MNPGGGFTAGLSGSQVNSFAGLTLRVTSDFVVGAFVGYEVFGYDIFALSGRLRGDGTTGGAYLGWRFLPGLRFDAGIAQSAIGYQATAGSATGAFSGSRTLFTSGLAGTFKLTPQLELEPSARFYGLWETEAAYQDIFGIQQASHDFSSGRTSAGAKLTYRLTSAGDVAIAPYLGVYADTYFGKDSAAAAALAAGQIMDGTSARVTAGVAFVTDYGARFAAGAEAGGLATNFTSLSLRVRGSVPF
jgi:outer membrane autotransporter protein